ncbi:NADPH:quinone reductase [Sphaerisporangium siamense]|uniref:NADPH2:quinone reductase n=1 Tax=Sphaerisporangium siamense TaxID=795645 RepID=A0A7W7G9R9_9ACTN|nr:zinc-binding dehydrogenase [Sphaerisporangium siamense]MBB4699236.1 NADPH2:quinone reductase [Sphaerisporangium siamense]GII86637.1 NADPH:quinone reductase [Sphaerisporangium siamense]
MRAVWLREFGGPEVLVPGEAPEPIPGPGQVVIEVAVIGIPFIETQVRSGSAPVPLPRLPIIPGNGVGGTVVAVGPGADPGLVGTRVVTSLGGSGGYAERVAAGVDGLIPVPPGLELAQAVALLADGRTAMGLARAAALRPGEWALVESAGGGVGSLLVQLAVNAGARVVAAAGSARKLDLAAELGAEVTVNYAEDGWDVRVSEAVGDAGVQVVFDGVGGAVGRAAFELLPPRGRFVLYGAAGGTVTHATVAEVFARSLTLITGWQLFASPADITAMAAAALDEAVAGRLRPVIGQTFPLEKAADAHAAIEARATLGKTLLTVPESVPKER